MAELPLFDDEDIPIKQFLSKTTLLKFLSFGSRCNGNASYSFSDATCDLTKLVNPNKPKGKGLWYGIPMTEIFETGYEFLKKIIDHKTHGNFSKDEIAAWKTLSRFFREKDIHEKNILNAIKEMSNAEKSKESILTMALAEHLIGKLSPGQTYVVDSRIKGKENKWKDSSYEKCRCGCGNLISLGATGLGHTEVWHGFADIVMLSSERKVECATNVCLDFNVGDGPSCAKKIKFSDDTDGEDETDEEEKDADCISEVKVLENVQDQAAAQIVVFALAHQTANPFSNVFIPNILICPSKFYFIMYDPVNDVLVWSTELPLFGHTDKRLQGVSIITLWMVMHYKLFCKGANEVFENVNEIKAGFKNHIDEDHWLIYNNQLRTGVASFGSVPRLNLVQSLCDVDYDIPKLKLKK